MAFGAECQCIAIAGNKRGLFVVRSVYYVSEIGWDTPVARGIFLRDPEIKFPQSAFPV